MNLSQSARSLFVTYPAVTISAITIALILSVTAKQNVSFSPINNNPQITNQVTKLAEAKFNPANTEWEYDFTKMKNGELPSNEWFFERGTTTAGYNNELQAYTPRSKNVRIENGALVIEAHKEKFANRDYTSARIDTRNLFSFTYGTLEVDMLVPEGRGTWPAAWLLPNNPRYKPADFGIADKDPLGWSINGEIDFEESIGSLPGQNIPSAHSYNEFHREPTYTPAYVSTNSTQYHRYGVIKTPSKITFTLDGVPYATRDKMNEDPLEWPFDQPYHLILNLAIGGTYAGTMGIDDTSSSWQLKVRSIKYSPEL